MTHKISSVGFLVCLATSFVALAAEESNRGISTQGNCLRKVAQDRGSVTLVTDVLAPSANESSKQAIKLSESLRSAVQALRLESAILESSSYSVTEDRRYEKEKWVSRGFRTRIGLTVETSQIGRLGDVIAVASQHGVKNVDGLSTFVSPEKMKAEREACLEVASQNAKDKAEKIAKGSGVRLGKILEMKEVTSDTPYYGRMGRASYDTMDASAGAAAAPTIESKPDQLVVNVLARFAID